MLELWVVMMVHKHVTHIIFITACFSYLIQKMKINDCDIGVGDMTLYKYLNRQPCDTFYD